VYLDSNVPPGNYTYMVRAVKLENTPSGTYNNLSQGILASITATAAPAPVTLLISQAPVGARLTWNSQSGSVYHVQSRFSLNAGLWTNLSPALTASSSSLSWTDVTVPAVLQRFYRVSNP
jgi:hypothetical protein